MDLIDQYLQAVGRLLPKAQRDDIVAELRDTILTRIEAREAELGRALTEAETEGVLREIGHPLLVAARYREGPQHVVGPALYPYWAFAVRVAIALQVVVTLIVFIVRTFSGGNVGKALGLAIGSGLTGAITLVGFATVVAWLIERRGLRIDYFDTWRVRDLTMLKYLSWDWDTFRDRVSGRGARTFARPWPRWRMRPPPIGRGLGAIAAGSVLVLWWIGALRFGVVGRVGELRELGLDPGPLEAVDWAGLRLMLFWPVLGYGLAVVLFGAVILARPRAQWLHGLLDIAIGAAVIAFACWLWTASPLAAAIQVDSLADLAVRLKRAALLSPPLSLAPFVSLAVGITALGGLGQILRGLWRLAAPARAVP